MNFETPRRAVIGACRALADRGFLAGVGGNVALRIDQHFFAVTPSGADYYSMSPEDVPVLTLPDLDIVAGRRRPSVESGLHARVFLTRADVQASVHTHQPVASAVALLDTSIPLSDVELRRHLGPRVELVSYAPSGTKFLVNALARRLSPDSNAYLLKNHGLLCVGPTLEAAIERVWLVELAAARFLEEALVEGRSPALHAINALAREGLAQTKRRSP
jgi:L-fuculose-phosphate aldolase